MAKRAEPLLNRRCLFDTHRKAICLHDVVAVGFDAVLTVANHLTVSQRTFLCLFVVCTVVHILLGAMRAAAARSTCLIAEDRCQQ